MFRKKSFEFLEQWGENLIVPTNLSLDMTQFSMNTGDTESDVQYVRSQEKKKLITHSCSSTKILGEQKLDLHFKS